MLLGDISDLASVTARFSTSKTGRREDNSDEDSGGTNGQPPGKKHKRKRNLQDYNRSFHKMKADGKKPQKPQDKNKGKEAEKKPTDPPPQSQNKGANHDQKQKDKKKDKKKEE
jgi:hypothetical protein